MTPEEHFRRLRGDDAWDLQEATPRAASRAGAPLRTASVRPDRTPIWATVVVAAVVAFVAVFAIQSVGSSPAGNDVGAPAATSSTPATPAPSAAARSAAPSPTATAEPEWQYDLHDPADKARGERVLACYRDHGVKIVGFTAPDGSGRVEIEYGGVHNDHESIVLGLQYQKVCDEVGARTE